MNEKKEKEDFEVSCYESEEGSICLKFGESAVVFSSKRFLEFADKLNEVRREVLGKYLHKKSETPRLVGTYRI